MKGDAWMEQESTVCKYPPAPFEMEQLPPSKALAGLWAELGPKKPMSAGCTMPDNDNRALEFNLLCTASKNPNPHSYCQGDPTDCITSLLGTQGCLQGLGQSAWGCPGLCGQAGNSPGDPGAV